MKKLVFTLLLVLCSLTIFAQYAPNTRWPYLYENFTQGTIFTGNQKSVAKLNIHLWGNVLHYVNTDGRIFQADDNGVTRVEIGDDAYIYSNHQLVKVVDSNGINLLVKLTKADFSRLQTSVGAYGSDLNSAATKNLSSLELGGLDKPELGKMLQEKSEGSTLSLNNEYFFIMNGLQIEADKSGVEKYLNDIKSPKVNDLKSFIKENKIKWKSEDKLSLVLKFLTD